MLLFILDRRKIGIYTYCFGGYCIFEGLWVGYVSFGWLWVHSGCILGVLCVGYVCILDGLWVDLGAQKAPKWVPGGPKTLQGAPQTIYRASSTPSIQNNISPLTHYSLPGPAGWG